MICSEGMRDCGGGRVRSPSGPSALVACPKGRLPYELPSSERPARRSGPTCLPRESRAIEDRRQPAPMLAFPFECATYRREGLGQRKNVGGDEQIGILSSHRMPVDAFRCYCNLRHQIGARKCDTLYGGTA